MSTFPFLCPKAPEWMVDWAALDDRFEWIRAMRECPQDPVWHAEGNVWIHVRMVCEALARLPEWRELGQIDREIVFAAAVLHEMNGSFPTIRPGGDDPSLIRLPRHR